MRQAVVLPTVPGVIVALYCLISGKMIGLGHGYGLVLAWPIATVLTVVVAGVSYIAAVLTPKGD